MGAKLKFPIRRTRSYYVVQMYCRKCKWVKSIDARRWFYDMWKSFTHCPNCGEKGLEHSKPLEHFETYEICDNGKRVTVYDSGKLGNRNSN